MEILKFTYLTVIEDGILSGTKHILRTEGGGLGLLEGKWKLGTAFEI